MTVAEFGSIGTLALAPHKLLASDKRSTHEYLFIALAPHKLFIIVLSISTEVYQLIQIQLPSVRIYEGVSCHKFKLMF